MNARKEFKAAFGAIRKALNGRHVVAYHCEGRFDVICTAGVRVWEYTGQRMEDEMYQVLAMRVPRPALTLKERAVERFNEPAFE